MTVEHIADLEAGSSDRDPDRADMDSLFQQGTEPCRTALSNYQTRCREGIPGDMERLQSNLDRLPSGSQLAAFALDSPGGALSEASEIAIFVSAGHLLVGVPPGATCASACFLVFAAAAKRVVAPDARSGSTGLQLEERKHRTRWRGPVMPLCLGSRQSRRRIAWLLGV